MRLRSVRLSNFQCFGPSVTTVDFSDVTYLLGPNGSGKTAVLHALARLFGFDPALRRIRKGDFHRPNGAPGTSAPATLWLEATFEFPDADDPDKESAAVPTFFSHMRLEVPGEPLQIRVRLTATIDDIDDIEEKIEYVLETNLDDEPEKTASMNRGDRNAIQVHYLPARRDPGSQITYAANSLLGRLLRAADWTGERDKVVEHTKAISDLLGANVAIAGFSDQLSSWWGQLHKGDYFSQPAVSFDRNEIDSLMRHLSVAFAPGHGEDAVDFARLLAVVSQRTNLAVRPRFDGWAR